MAPLVFAPGLVVVLWPVAFALALCALPGAAELCMAPWVSAPGLDVKWPDNLTVCPQPEIEKMGWPVGQIDDPIKEKSRKNSNCFKDADAICTPTPTPTFSSDYTSPLHPVLDCHSPSSSH
ncbi:unnamed protein product [Pleuronectes platessa]|uniref:Uncharacterized protein n=1 Tax=Pleuronectes platessa TaxID=8262 RepID=A0A9N7UJW1_PLEPL|nr:unnamed protein product [Pleuronectes platessa]